ncbi:guanine nucleotide-binding protein subunit beta-like protein 1 [Contarinia nasturtii]|uniref:guanine nucleotide-binding protein subunit beta-like protein 1 n=1 Tax=Contarinia nasturtii TaxID=265458 RepID=UPI0012D38E19|nr:guanine nucleotide-binding protein subunit beta-like protein 1 [Contarinia nasturtii]
MAVLPPDPVFSMRSSDMGAVNCICFHSTERLFSGTAKGAVYLWDMQTCRSPLHFSIGGNEPVTSIYHGEETLVTQQKGGILKRWHIANAGYVLDSTNDIMHNGFCRFVTDDDARIYYPKNDNEICVSKLNHDVDDNDQTMILNPKAILDERKEPPSVDGGGRGATTTAIQQLGSVMCVQPLTISSQSYLLAGYESGCFLTWDLRTGNVINVAQFEECPIAFDFCAEANRGIYGNTSDKLGIFGYQRTDMKLINRGDISIKNAGINCVRIRKDQKVFSTGGTDGRIRVFSWKSLRPLTVLTEHRAAVNDIVYSPGKCDLWKSPIMACAGNDGVISLWNLYNN